LSRILFRFEVKGTEYIPQRDGALIASNHTSYFDPPLIGMAAPRHIFYFAKEELFDSFLGPLIRFVNAIPVNRNQLDRKTLKQLLNIIGSGEVLLVFPEGTRSHNGELQEGKAGIGLLAYYARVPVIPAYISGSHDILPRNAKFIHFKKCSVQFGPPVELAQFYSEAKTKDMYYRISQEIMNSIKQLKESTS
jgi:1-acyl-sn-glycerol-3-phosphate acyltransferase